MRTYWYGDGKVIRVPLASVSLTQERTIDEGLQTVAARLGYPTLLDWSTRVDAGDEVLVFAPHDPGATTTVPGREDLEAESLILWIRRGIIASVFFAKTIADVVTILSMLAAYEKALCEITEYRERSIDLRGRHAASVVGLNQEVARS